MESEQWRNLTLQASVTDCELLLIDLDNTLYAEIDYLFPAYQQAAQAVFDEFGFPDADELSGFLQSGFRSHSRQGLFQTACEKFGLEPSAATTMLEGLRSAEVPGGIHAFPFMIEFIERANGLAVPWAVVTNGNVMQQKNKMRQLRPHHLFSGTKVYYCDEYRRKPDPAALLAACRDFSVLPERAMMIGDHMVDRLAAEAAGVRYLLVDALRGSP